jgi:hypothetical protein
MKKIALFGALVATLLLASCYKDNNRYNNNGASNSDLTFWMAANCSTSPVTVTVDGQTGQISEYFPTTQPTCGAYGCANFNLPAGTFTYTATGNDTTWSGSVVVTQNACKLQQLQCSNGTVTFWVDSAANNTKVTIAGESYHISVAFPTSTPACGTSGCANFNLPTGSYTYTAVTGSNIGYTGSVNIGNDSCSLVRLF